jgi:hypothetical protein
MRRISTAPQAVRRFHARTRAGATGPRRAADRAAAGWKMREHML